MRRMLLSLSCLVVLSTSAGPAIAQGAACCDVSTSGIVLKLAGALVEGRATDLVGAAFGEDSIEAQGRLVWGNLLDGVFTAGVAALAGLAALGLVIARRRHW